MRTRVKICGLTRAADAEVAIAAGADALGVVFAPSPRRIGISQAAEVLASAPTHVVRVGVFVDEPEGFIAEAVAACGLTAVQVHGGHALELAERLAVPVVPVVGVGLPAENFAWDRVAQIAHRIAAAAPAPPAARSADATPPAHAAAAPTPGIPALPRGTVLLDTAIAGKSGGTGRTFAWAEIGRIPAGLTALVAGGLTPENAATCVRALRPFGVDVSSGVEASPGIKDHESIKKFIAAVRAANEEVSSDE